MKITLDTNILPADDLVDACRVRGWDIAVTSVSRREIEGTSYIVQLMSLGEIMEVAVHGEIRYGEGLYGSDRSGEQLELILKIVSDSSFPKDRRILSAGHRRQFRDALIFEAHTRNRRDIFVSNDHRAFITRGRRNALQQMFGTQIMTKTEFLEFCTANPPTRPNGAAG